MIARRDPALRDPALCTIRKTVATLLEQSGAIEGVALGLEAALSAMVFIAADQAWLSRCKR